MYRIEINKKVESVIDEIFEKNKLNASIKKQFLHLIENEINDNYERSDLIRMIESLDLKDDEEII